MSCIPPRAMAASRLQVLRGFGFAGATPAFALFAAACGPDPLPSQGDAGAGADAGAPSDEGGEAQRRVLELENSLADGASEPLRVDLTTEDEGVDLVLECDREPECAGWLDVAIVEPDPCDLLDDAPQCGGGDTEPDGVEVATLELQSLTERERVLPVAVSPDDGASFSGSRSMYFGADHLEEVIFALDKDAGGPDLVVEVSAEWEGTNPADSAQDLESFLATVPGLEFEDRETAYPGYRAYALSYDQPLDHDNPSGRSFSQRMVLHHKGSTRPTILYTSGYGLTEDYLSELTNGLGANQLTTEQRFFEDSIVDDVQPEDWHYVTVRQAATDHHRIASALRAFYDRPWVSTGHSKGGMTSVYHRRFFPDDIEVTVPYVAPISFAAPDPQYIPFLNQIGDDECREALRDLQREALDRFEALREIADDRPGGPGIFASREIFERVLTGLEWSYWQVTGIDGCPGIPEPSAASLDIYEAIDTYSNTDLPNDPNPGSSPYYYQALRELGFQSNATEHLEERLEHEPPGEERLHPLLPPDVSPPTHSPDTMNDVQGWVLEDASELLFIYGEYDPWTGGAFATGDRSGVIAHYAPQASHGARIRDLEAGARNDALEMLDHWIGARPSIAPGTQLLSAREPPELHRNLRVPAQAGELDR